MMGVRIRNSGRAERSLLAGRGHEMDKLDRLAQQTLQRLAEVWQIDSKRITWVNPEPHGAPGFDWWPGDFCVSARAEMPNKSSDEAEFKVIVRTNFLKDVALESDRFQEGAAVMARSSTSTYAWVYPSQDTWNRLRGVVRGPSLWFSSTAYISEKAMGWLPDLIANTAIIQPINAQLQAQRMAEMLGCGKPDTSRPAALGDAGLDDILEVIANVYAPLGQDPSRWADTDEFEQFAEKWGKSDNCFGFGDATGMTLETPFGNDSALIRFLTSEKHPQLGHGLLATLQLPFSDGRSIITKSAAELNLVEAVSWTGFPQLGCWHPNENKNDKDELAFSLFVPNALYEPGLTTLIAFWFLQRARWARKLMFPDIQDRPMIDILKRRFGELDKS
jgi:hypothetical protein